MLHDDIKRWREVLQQSGKPICSHHAYCHISYISIWVSMFLLHRAHNSTIQGRLLWTLLWTRGDLSIHPVQLIQYCGLESCWYCGYVWLVREGAVHFNALITYRRDRGDMTIDEEHKPWGTPWWTGEVLDLVFNIEVMTAKDGGNQPVEWCTLDPHWL